MIGVNYRDAVRRSLFVKIAIFLKYESRNMGEYSGIDRTGGQIRFDVLDNENNATPWAIRAVVAGEPFIYPGVNVEFLNEIDQTPERLRKKRYKLGVAIRVCCDITGNRSANAAAVEARQVVTRVLTALSDGSVEIIDYSDILSPNPTGNRASWGRLFDTGGIDITDESLAVASGVVQYRIQFQLSFPDFSY